MKKTKPAQIKVTQQGKIVVGLSDGDVGSELASIPTDFAKSKKLSERQAQALLIAIAQRLNIL